MDTSSLSLPLFTNLLPQSARSLLVAWDPLACALASLRSRYGHASSASGSGLDVRLHRGGDGKLVITLTPMPSDADAGGAEGDAAPPLTAADAMRVASEMSAVVAGVAAGASVVRLGE